MSENGNSLALASISLLKLRKALTLSNGRLKVPKDTVESILVCVVQTELMFENFNKSSNKEIICSIIIFPICFLNSSAFQEFSTYNTRVSTKFLEYLQQCGLVSYL